MKKLFILSLLLLVSFCSSEESSSSSGEVVSEEQTVETVPEPDIDIWEAAKNGDIQAIKQHILFGTDLSSKHSNRDNTPLIIAACHGQYEAVRTLLDAGVDINESNVEDVTAQFCAVFFGRTDVVQLLKDEGADPNITMNLDLTAMDLVSVEWDSTRSQAVGVYKLTYGVKVDTDEVEAAHPLIMEILNSGSSVSSEATTESATTDSATTESATCEPESSSLPAHMTIICEPAKIYFASDLSSNVQENFKYGVALAQERFGNYPTQIMVVGTDRDAMLDLANTYCTLKEEADQLWYFKDKDECIMLKTREETGYDYPYYLRVGIETIENNYPNSGSKGHNGGLEYGHHEFTWAYPVGLESTSAEGYNTEIIAISHEWWHAFQQAHINPLYNCDGNRCQNDGETLDSLMGPMSFVEGTAVFMEFIYGQELNGRGVLTGVRSMQQEYKNRYKNGEDDMQQCPGTSIRDITYQLPCRQAGYNWGLWASAYLAHKVKDPYVFETNYYPTLKETKDREEAFQKTFGFSTEEFYSEFDSWIKGPESERNIVIPSIEVGTGRAYYP